jgi:putative holliday junction resolvase
MATNLLGLDIGEKRIGVARVNLVAKLPQPLNILKNDNQLLANLTDLITEYEIDGLIVGLPRNLQGLETAQSRYVKEFTARVLSKLNLPITYFDETLSSVAAEERIGSNNPKEAIDAQAACIILEDYLESLA